MIRKLVRQMLAAQILAAMTVSLCLLVDNIMIGRYLGERALTAYGLASPMVMIIGAFGGLLCAGAQVSCSKSLGRGNREETDIGYSTTLAVGGAFSVVFMAAALLLSGPIARVLGAGEPMLHSDTSRYIVGFSIGAPAIVGALTLVPFLQMAGQSGLLIVAVLSMTAADVAFDLLNVRVFHGGMFGMGLASALSYYVAILISAAYFLSKRCVFSFSLKRVRTRKIREMIADGMPSLFGMVSSVVMVFVLNRILLHAGGEGAVAAYSVISTVMNATNSISTGTGGVALTLSGVLANEEDRTGLTELLRALFRASVVLGLGMMALMMAFAPQAAAFFMPEAGAGREMAIRGLRCFSLGLFFCCLTNALRSCYQGTGRVGLMEIISVADNAVLPIGTAFVLSRIAGVNGIWFFFLASEVLTIAGILAYVCLKKGRKTWRTEDLLLLRKDFGVPPEDMMEAAPDGIEAVLQASREAEAFCRARGGSQRLAAHLALCVEEMGGNIVTHGFSAGKNRHLSIRLLRKEGRWTLRFRDDCMAFDPVAHVSGEDTREEVGIRLAMRVADEARYTYSMNLNNLTLVLGEKTEPVLTSAR